MIESDVSLVLAGWLVGWFFGWSVLWLTGSLVGCLLVGVLLEGCLNCLMIE